MNGLIDIHSHILPLVDDGAESVEMALLMLKKAAEEGIEKIILTPHQKKKYRCSSIRGMRFFTAMGSQNCWIKGKYGLWRIPATY